MANIFKNKYLGYWIFSITIVLVLTVPKLVQDGMFQDAMLYSSVSHNLSQGIGTFWFPQYSKLNIAGLSSFHEHPPLVFGIQAIFFNFLGSSIYVERFYTFLMMCLNMLLILLIWKKVFKNDPDLAALAFLPILFWISYPVCSWSFTNNMQENTLSVFALGAVLLMLYNLDTDKYRPVKWVIAGVLICFATLCKGLPGFFLLSVPVIFWLSQKKATLQKAIFQTSILVATVVIFYLILFNIPESRESLSIYLFERVLVRLDSMPTADYRMQILWRLFTESIPQLMLAGIILGLAKWNNITIRFYDNKSIALFFILIGLSASVPLTLTMVQKGFYLVPAFPYFAIGFAILLAPIVSDLIEKKNTLRFRKTFTIISGLLLVTVLSFTWMQKGKLSREMQTMHDVYKIGTLVPKFSAITIPPEMYDEYDFVLQGFLVRYFNISIDPFEKHQFFLIEKKLQDNIPEHYEKVNLKLKKYILYQRL